MDNAQDITLSEIRKLSNKFDELSLQIRVDTPWMRLKGHIRYAVKLLKEIPTGSRLLVFAALMLCTFCVFAQISPEAKKKIMFVAMDMVSLALLILGQA